MPILLGIDTGGTYTDAVLFDEAAGVVATAKALTTKADLALGIGNAVDAVLEQSSIKAHDIALVSLSTTLATNALVEGQGGRICLVLIGFDEATLTRAGLADALADDPHILLAGGHDAGGKQTAELDLDGLLHRLGDHEDQISGYAIAAQFAVRNPAHEIAARDAILERTGRPVTCSHELSSKLDGPRRALTCVLNAKLINMIYHLIDAAEGLFVDRGIDAPLTVVRGDGALISADVARVKPIETILSGPAASIVGAAYLTGTRDAVVSDIGGTTTDYAFLQDGTPRLNAEGATVGGWRTMVEAVDMRTVGLGGDSEVHALPDGLGMRLELGPRRLVPVSLFATEHRELVHSTLDRQLKQPRHGDHDGRFVFPVGRQSTHMTALSRQESVILDRIAQGPAALDQIITTRPQLSTLNRLVARGLVGVSGFTPSDAAHVLGRHDAWDSEAATGAAALFARQKNARGEAMAPDAQTMSEWVFETLVCRSAETLMEAALREDGRLPGELARGLIAAKQAKQDDLLIDLQIGLSRPVIGLGASAPTYYRAVAGLLGTQAVIPEHTGVANAIGAVVGHVRVTCHASISQPEQGVFKVFGIATPQTFSELETAIAFVEQSLEAEARRKADKAGAGDIKVKLVREDKNATIEGQIVLIEATITAMASGRPRIAVSPPAKTES